MKLHKMTDAQLEAMLEDADYPLSANIENELDARAERAEMNAIYSSPCLQDSMPVEYFTE